MPLCAHNHWVLPQDMTYDIGGDMNHCQAAGRCTRTGLFVSLLIALAIVSAPLVYGQGLSGTMTGIVQDQTKALIPNANISLIDQATGAARRTVTNAEGFFSITAIPA